MSDTYKNPDIETITPTDLKVKISWSISFSKIKQTILKIKKYV